MEIMPALFYFGDSFCDLETHSFVSGLSRRKFGGRNHEERKYFYVSCRNYMFDQRGERTASPADGGSDCDAQQN
jgi:hypothetical protein